MAEIKVRPAIATDLSKAIVLDCKVTREYFGPLFLQYNDPDILKDVAAFMDTGTQAKIESFQQAINQENNQYLYLAFDQDRVIGLISFEKHETEIELHLLIIDPEYRRQQIGNLLLNAALNSSNNIKSCVLLCLDKNIYAQKFHKELQ